MITELSEEKPKILQANQAVADKIQVDWIGKYLYKEYFTYLACQEM